MAKRIKQFRYFNSNESREGGENSPTGLKYQHLQSGSAFATCLPIYQLGIQALPGTKFYINNSVDPIIIGSTGVYELSLSGDTQISALSFSPTSIAEIEANDNAYLLVDIIYDDGE